MIIQIYGPLHNFLHLFRVQPRLQDKSENKRIENLLELHLKPGIGIGKECQTTETDGTAF